MRDPEELYRLEDDRPDLGRPVLVQALGGFVDAGAVTRLASEQLVTTLGSRLICTFDVDDLYDYRTRRPTMIFVRDHWEHYEAPRLELHALHDSAGTPFLLLFGAEPDLRWEAFVAALIALIERLQVRLTVGFNAIPMAVPHTRPVGVTAHATRGELIAGYEPWLQRIQVPASAGHLLEYRLGKAGHDAVGFAAHVPHYLAQTEYPAAAAVLVDSLARVSGLSLPTAALQEAAGLVRADVDRQIADAEEAAALVRALEQQYDAYQQGQESNLLANRTGPLPTADELGAELERFLAEQTKPGEPPAI